MKEWENDAPLNIRTRLAIRLLLLCVKLLAPYSFEHQFQSYFKQIEDELKGDTTRKK
jgi:hypothetical protein